jgi:mannitol-1-/sugar-/sorbitol-6-phosphatase
MNILPAMRRYDCSAVIFDLDGVLVDSAAFVERQWRRWAEARGLSPEPFLRVCHGRRAVETIRLAAPHLDAEAEAAGVSEDDLAGPGIAALPGAERLLTQLPAATWAVATSGTRAAALARLRHAGLPEPRVMICAEDVVRGKPHPEVYQRAASALGAPPAECVVIEDAPAGLEAARAAGIPAIGLATTHDPSELPAEVCAGSLADIHVGRIGDGLELLVIDLAGDRLPAPFEPRRMPRVRRESKG